MARPATAAVRLLAGEREPVRLATTHDIALSGLQVIDGIMTEVGDRVLVKDQTDKRQNGIYTASAGAWFRASDARDSRAITEGVTVNVQEGSTNDGRAYRFKTVLPKVGVDEIAIQFYMSANFLQDALDELGVIATSTIATNDGAGTANAIQATIPIELPSAGLIALPIVEANTDSSVTVSFNGGAPLTIKTNTGNAPSPAGLAPGMVVLGIVSGSTFRMVSDQVSAAIIAQAEGILSQTQSSLEAAAEAIISDAEAIRDQAQAAATAAGTSAASLNLPALVAGNEGKALVAKPDLSGYEIGYSGSDLFNQTISYFASLSMETAEFSPAAIAAGPDGNGFFDGFNALTYVDTAGSSGLDTATAGQLKPVVGAETTERSGTSDGTTNFPDFTIGDRGWSLDNGKTVTSIGISTNAVINNCRLMIVKRTAAGVYDVVYTSPPFNSVAGSGFTDQVLDTPFAVPATGEYYIACYFPVTGFVNTVTSGSRFSVAGLASGNGVAITEATASRTPVTRATYLGPVSALTTQSVPLNLASTPQWARLFAIIKKNGAVVNTDITFKVSRNGSAFLTLPMTQKFTRPDGTVLLDSGTVNITSIAAGTVGKWQIVTANGRTPSIYAVGIMFGVNA